MAHANMAQNNDLTKMCHMSRWELLAAHLYECLVSTFIDSQKLFGFVTKVKRNTWLILF